MTAAVDDGPARDVVAAAADADLQAIAARELDARGDVGGRAAAHDERRPAVDEAVVHAPRRFIGVFARLQHGAGNTGSKLFDDCFVRYHGHENLRRVGSAVRPPILERVRHDVQPSASRCAPR